jgi:hypothetical protein
MVEDSEESLADAPGDFPGEGALDPNDAIVSKGGLFLLVEPNELEAFKRALIPDGGIKQLKDLENSLAF